MVVWGVGTLCIFRSVVPEQWHHNTTCKVPTDTSFNCFKVGKTFAITQTHWNMINKGLAIAITWGVQRYTMFTKISSFPEQPFNIPTRSLNVQQKVKFQCCHSIFWNQQVQYEQKYCINIKLQYCIISCSIAKQMDSPLSDLNWLLWKDPTHVLPYQFLATSWPLWQCMASYDLTSQQHNLWRKFPVQVL